MARVYIETYGCALNKSDSSLMAELLARAGHELAKSAEEADVVVVNTCTVRKDSEDRILKRLAELSKVDGKKLVVAGCMASAQPYTVRAAAPKATLVGVYGIHRIVEAVESSEPRAFLEYSDAKRELLPCYELEDGVVAAVPLADGCLNKCSFCITVHARPVLLSRSPKKIVELVRKLVERGFYEIQLTGQDVAVYGYDIVGRQLLPDLLEELLTSVEGNYALRIGMMTPGWFAKIMDRMLELYKDERVYKFFHLPLESGDNRVLRLMKRNYTAEDFEEIVKEVRSKVSDAYIATDVIVGHPGEDEGAFENTVELLKRLEPDRVHVAQYTPRPFTLAARMKQVPDPVKKERSRRLAALCEEIGLRRHARYVGKAIEAVVVEKVRRGAQETYVARTKNYISVVLTGGEPVELGRRVRVHVAEATFFDLRGYVTRVERKSRGEERGSAKRPLASGP